MTEIDSCRDDAKRHRRWLAGLAAVFTVIATAPQAHGAGAAAPTVPAVRDISPAAGKMVGVGQPITVRYESPVADRAAAVAQLRVSTTRPIDGTVTWLSDSAFEWSPREFWPAHSEIAIQAGDVKTQFDTGASVVAIADLDAYTFTVTIDDEVVREMPASMGKPGFETPLGTFRVLEKQRNVVFDSRTIGIPLDDPEGYLIDGEYGVRVTWGGVYVHSAPWSVGSQGYANVSHGCINLSPDNAAWYFDIVKVGDPVIVRA